MNGMSALAYVYAAIAGMSWHTAVDEGCREMMLVAALALGAGVGCVLLATVWVT